MGGFDRPLFLLLLLALPLYAVLSRSGLLKRFVFPLTLGDWNGSAVRWTPAILRVLAVVSRLCLALAFIFAVVGGAGPVRYRSEALYGSRGNSVIFALDVSPSMAARDMHGETRLEAAKSYIRSFARKRPGDSCGLVGFGSDAALLVPPTRDSLSFSARLDTLRIGEFGDGTALGLGLGVAAAHLASDTSDRSVAVLLTDGENNAGAINPLSAAALCRDRNIALYVIGIGSRGEVPVDYVDPATGTAYSGILDSWYDEAALRDIAFRAGGQYVSASNAPDLADAFTTIGASLPASPISWTRTVEQPLESGFIAAAAAFAAFAWVIRRLLMGAIV